MTTRRPAITATCPTCGPFQTRASEVTRCKTCHRSVRIPAELRQARREQVEATQVPTLKVAPLVDAPRIKPVVAVKPVMPLPVAVQPVMPVLDYDPDDSQDELTEPVTPTDPALSSKVAAAIEQAARTGRTLAMQAPTGIAQQADKLLTEAEQHIAGLTHSVEPGDQWGMLTVKLSCKPMPEQQRIVAVEDGEQERIVAAQQVATARKEIVKQAGRRRKARRLSCTYCGAVPGQSTPALFPVSSPAFDDVRLLCYRCAAGELSIPGAVAGESIVSIPAEGGVLVDMHAVKTLIETGRLAIERVLAE